MSGSDGLEQCASQALGTPLRGLVERARALLAAGSVTVPDDSLACCILRQLHESACRTECRENAEVAVSLLHARRLSRFWDSGSNASLASRLGQVVSNTAEFSAFFERPSITGGAAQSAATGGWPAGRDTGAVLRDECESVSNVGREVEDWLHANNLHERLLAAYAAYAICEDESATLMMTSRLVCNGSVQQTGFATPLGYVARQLGSMNRGCGAGMCWCSEPLKLPDDYSRWNGRKLKSALPAAPAFCGVAVPMATAHRVELDIWKHPAILHMPNRRARLNSFDEGASWIALTCTPSAVSVDHLRAMSTETVMTVPASLKDWDPLEERGANVRLGGLPVDTTIGMAKYACEGLGLEAWLERWNASPEQACCATMLWLASLSETTRSTLEAAGLKEVPLKNWPRYWKEVSVCVRRTARVGVHVAGEWMELRKAVNVNVRTSEQADWAGEVRKRTSACVQKLLPATGRYWGVFEKEARASAAKVVTKMKQRRDHQALSEAWAERSLRAPNGSSSMSAVAKATGALECAVGSDRTTKKAALSCVDGSWLKGGIESTLVALMRVSTKHEPGAKNRALYAAGDLHSWLHAYALSGFEASATNEDGMCPSQRPEEVGDWFEESDQVVGTEVLGSGDLDDYNSLHTLPELACMHLARGDAFAGKSASLLTSADLASCVHKAGCYGVEQQRAASMYKCGASLGRSIMTGSILCSALSEAEQEAGQGVGGYTEAVRMWLSLGSGGRNTTGDNTNKHAIDVVVSVEEARLVEKDAGVRAVSLSGDDETMKHRTYCGQCAYMGVLRLGGWKMNAAKQLTGRSVGEYLQRCIDGDHPVMQPAASILATLCFGNWYRPTGEWLTDCVASQFQNWAEACSRGLPRTPAARMCGMICDNVMTRNGKVLLWRPHACHERDGRFLFGGIPGFGSERWPDLVVRRKAKPEWDGPGIAELLAQPKRQWIMRQLDKGWLKDQYVEGLRTAAFGGSAQTSWRDELNKTMEDRWESVGLEGPYFHEVPLGLVNGCLRPGLSTVCHAWRVAKSSMRVVTIEDQYAALGIGQEEAALLGGLMPAQLDAPLDLRCKMPELQESMVDEHRAAMDSGVRAALMSYSCPHPALGITSPKPHGKHVVVLAAGNGNRISQLARQGRQREAMRVDRLAKVLIGLEAYRRPSSSPLADEASWASMERVVAESVARQGHRALTVLATHHRPNQLAKELENYGIRVTRLRLRLPQAQIDAAMAKRDISAGLQAYMDRSLAELDRDTVGWREVNNHAEVWSAAAA